MKRNQILVWLVGVSLLSASTLRGQESKPTGERQGSSARSLAEESASVISPGVLSRETQAAAPRLVKFSGVLTELPSGSLNGPMEMTLALYKDELGGEPLWTEIQNVEVDKLGRYTVLLGATLVEGLPFELFPSGEPRWLSVEIQGQPRQARALLVGVPYALKALDSEKLGGKPASDFVSSASLKDQVRQVIQSQSEVAGQAVSTGTPQAGQPKASSAASPQTTSAAGPKHPPTTFSGTNSTQIVGVQQNGSGNGLYAQTASSTGASGVVGIATSTSTSSFQNGVYGQNAGAGAGVAGIATNTSAGVGVYGQSANFAGVFGQGATSGVFGRATATSGPTSGVSGDGGSSPMGGGVFGSSFRWVGVGGQATATSGGPAYGVWGDSLSSEGAGVAGYADAPSGFNYGVFGQSVSPDGRGVLGVNTSASGGTGVTGVAYAATGNTFGVMGNSASTAGIGVFGNVDAASGNNIGVLGQTFSPNGSGVTGVAAATSGNTVAVLGQNASTSGIAVQGNANATSGNTVAVLGQNASTSGIAVWGAYGFAPTAGGGVGVKGSIEAGAGNGVAGQFVNVPGQGLLLQGISGNTLQQVFSVDPSGNLQMSGNLTVSGTKSSTAKLHDGREVAFYAVESPENWFEDFGSAELTSGVAWIPLEAAFGEATNATVSYHVFLTPNGDSNGLYVARKTAAGFEVREHAGGGSNVAFDYRIVVRRRGYETLRMAEVQHDVKNLESSRQHLTQLANSGNLRKPLAPIVPQAVPPHTIRPVVPRPSVPKPPQPTILQVPQGIK